MSLRRLVGLLALVVSLVASLIAPVAVAAQVVDPADPAEEAAVSPTPALVAVVDSDGVRRCAGVVVGELHVLTAAHCAGAVAGGTVFGAAAERRIIEIAEHPAAESGDAQSFDVALLTVDAPFGVDPLPLAGSVLEREIVAATSSIEVHLIDGASERPAADVIEMRFTSFVDCQAAFRGYDDSTHTCARSTADGGVPCDGDSGSPAVVSTDDGLVIVGVASYGAFGCVPGAPFAFARVAPAQRWVAQQAGVSAAGTELGYTLLTDDARTFAFGGAVPVPSGDLVFPSALVGDPDGQGHWLLHTWGGLEPHDAVELHARPCGAFADDTVPCAGWVAAAVDGEHAWLVHESGHVWSTDTDDALGDAASIEIDAPIVDAVATPTGRGRYLLGADGGVFTFGDAGFHGSVPGLLGTAAADIEAVALMVTASGAGYWIVTADGGVFAFGDADFLGSVPGVLGADVALAAPVVGAAATATGYVLAAADGGVFTFGDAPFLGSLGGTGATADVIDIAVVDTGDVADQRAAASIPDLPAAAAGAFVVAARHMVAERAVGFGATVEQIDAAYDATETVVTFDPSVLRTVEELVERNSLLDTTRLASEWIAANRQRFDDWVEAIR